VSHASDSEQALGKPGKVLAVIKARRVTREFTADPVPDDAIRLILEAARWAPSGGGRRLNVYVVVRDELNLRKLRAAAPGILGYPPAVIVMCIDHAKAATFAFDDTDHGSAFVDLGTAAQNMLLAAAELQLGACPVMSFHKGAVRTLLRLPEMLEPAMMVILGYPAVNKTAASRPRLKLATVEETTYWEFYDSERATP
jgi:nitroreductase